MGSKLWGGRFSKQTDPLMERFSRSLDYDRRLAEADIEAGCAHAEVLARAGLISSAEQDRIVRALGGIRQDLASGKIDLDAGSHEDIHSLILDELGKRAGNPGKKLHAGRSRNDLVSLDTRLYLREALGAITAGLCDLQSALIGKGSEYEDLIFPGMTHTQHAQIVLFPHHLMAYVEMLERDRGRIADASTRMEVLPAGSAAMGGSTLKLDKRQLGKSLGFSQISQNSMDAVSDRDFVIETLSALAIIGMHLSRLCEELVWWSSSEIGFIELDEPYCTGSSFLPQKRNPDSAELIRGKTGRLYGNLVSVLTMMKGLPLTYNRDMQEDKEPLFDSLTTISDSLALLAGMIRTMTVNREAVSRALEEDFSAASDLAEFLVTKGITFQKAHSLVGELVRRCLEEGRDFSRLTLRDLTDCCPKYTGEALGLLQPLGSLKAKKTTGSSAPRLVRAQLERWRKYLDS